MRSEPRLAEMPVVAMSVGGSEARAATLAAGADLFLDKPLVLKDLFSTLERLNSHGASR
jgi:CheY-like chemotaxis protein